MRRKIMRKLIEARQLLSSIVGPTIRGLFVECKCARYSHSISCLEDPCSGTVYESNDELEYYITLVKEDVIAFAKGADIDEVVARVIVEYTQYLREQIELSHMLDEE
jgi:hypothetical protein